MNCFRLICWHCQEPILTTPRLSDPELGRLRGHLDEEHLRVALVADTQAGALLWHFKVEAAHDGRA